MFICFYFLDSFQKITSMYITSITTAPVIDIKNGIYLFIKIYNSLDIASDLKESIKFKEYLRTLKSNGLKNDHLKLIN